MENKAFWKHIIFPPGPVLDPVSRLSEVIFGLIMVLTFTGSISVATAGREEIGVVLWAALGCNVAWGIVDAFMYLMALMLERGNGANAMRKAQKAVNAEETAGAINDLLPPVLAAVMKPADYEDIRLELKKLPEPPAKIPLFWPDIKAAILIFILVTVSTFPCTIPFLLIKDPVLAMRVSNWVALTLLFITGFYLGRLTGYNKWLVGVLVAVLGAVLVIMTMALGG
jgi:VIT family